MFLDKSVSADSAFGFGVYAAEMWCTDPHNRTATEADVHENRSNAGTKSEPKHASAAYVSIDIATGAMTLNLEDGLSLTWFSMDGHTDAASIMSL